MYQAKSYIIALLTTKPMMAIAGVLKSFKPSLPYKVGSFGAIPTQMCHFHQILIIRRYLTTKPKYLASQELLVLTKTLTTTNQEIFTNALTAWYDKHKAT